jgi:hypothetical protein
MMAGAHRWTRLLGGGRLQYEPAELVQADVAAAGDWVAEGAHGERWPISAQRFAREYQ